MAATDVIAGRVVQELQDKGVGPNGAILRFRDESGNIVSGVDNKGVFQALQGVGYPSGVVSNPISIQSSSILPRPGKPMWVLLQASGLGSQTGISGGAVTPSSLIQNGSLASGTTIGVSESQSGAIKKQYDFPVGSVYTGYNVSTAGASNVQVRQTFGQLSMQPYVTAKLGFQLANSATGRFWFGYSDSVTSIASLNTVAGGIPGNTVSFNIFGFRLVWGGAGTKDATWQAFVANSTNKLPGTAVDTGVVPDFINAHVYTAFFDGTNFIFQIDNKTVATIAGTDANAPSMAATANVLTNHGMFIVVDNNQTATLAPTPNQVDIKYMYSDLTSVNALS